MPTNPAPLCASPGSRSRTRVLVLDDDSFQLELLAEHLRGMGFIDLTCVASAPEALRRVGGRRDSFDLILIDLHLPEMDGFQFMEGLAQVDYRGAVLIVSGQAPEVVHGAALVAQLRRFKLLGVVAKPVERGPLAALINGSF